MTAIATIREALAAQVTTTTGLACLPYAPATPVAPMAYIGAADGQYVNFDVAMAQKLFTVSLKIGVLVTINLLEHAQEEMDGYLDRSAGSIIAAVEADRSLGGIVSTVRVTGATGLDVVTAGGVEYGQCEVGVEVTATRDFGWLVHGIVHVWHLAGRWSSRGIG